MYKRGRDCGSMTCEGQKNRKTVKRVLCTVCSLLATNCVSVLNAAAGSRTLGEKLTWKLMAAGLLSILAIDAVRYSIQHCQLMVGWLLLLECGSSRQGCQQP